MKTPPTSPPWMPRALLAAALCNVVLGGWIVLWPDAAFAIAGVAAPNYPPLWQSLGVIAAVFGLGYAISAANPARHWPIVLLGLIAKILAPASIAHALWTGALPWTIAWMCAALDLVWWAPFAIILRHAWETFRNEGTADAPSEAAALRETHTSRDSSLTMLSFEKPVLLVMLRHAGCTFCRNAMADISRLRPRIESTGAEIVLGHMGTASEFTTFAQRYGLGEVAAVADPERRLYLGLGLKRGTFMQLFGPRVWWRGAKAFFSGHGAGKVRGDATQMPGAFLIHEGRVLRRFEHQDASDKPDYVGLATLPR